MNTWIACLHPCLHPTIPIYPNCPTLSTPTSIVASHHPSLPHQPYPSAPQRPLLVAPHHPSLPHQPCPQHPNVSCCSPPPFPTPPALPSAPQCLLLLPTTLPYPTSLALSTPSSLLLPTILVPPTSQGGATTGEVQQNAAPSPAALGCSRDRMELGPAGRTPESRSPAHPRRPNALSCHWISTSTYCCTRQMCERTCMRRTVIALRAVR